MPELPEVETVVRGLRASVIGRRILSVRLGKTDFIEDPVALAERLPGSRILEIQRYGKFISLELEPQQNSGARFYLVVHLGMTGRLIPRPAQEDATPHTHGFFELDDGRELRYTDVRRFGRILLVADTSMETFRSKLGADPLEISKAEFHVRLSGRCAMIKALLLNQSVLRGLGNIYADESLWGARIHPARHAARLTPTQVSRLYRAIRRVLQEAIRLGGSSISDYVNAEGQPGFFQFRHRAYGREGKPCHRCRTKIRRIIVAGRSSYFCPRCQAAPRQKPGHTPR